jgi:hypothetical protein
LISSGPKDCWFRSCCSGTDPCSQRTYIRLGTRLVQSRLHTFPCPAADTTPGRITALGSHRTPRSPTSPHVASTHPHMRSKRPRRYRSFSSAAPTQSSLGWPRALLGPHVYTGLSSLDCSAQSGAKPSRMSFLATSGLRRLRWLWRFRRPCD